MRLISALACASSALAIASSAFAAESTTAAADQAFDLGEIVVTAPKVVGVAIGSGAWIDVLQDGKVLTSIAHGQGPACTTIRKMVDFDLKPGRYVIQLSANADPTLAVIVTSAPKG